MNKHYNVLYLCLEFEKWNIARPWTFQANLGLEDGFSKNNLTYLTITTPWLSNVKELCKDFTFDQVWIEIVHQNPKLEILEWIEKIAPIRIGLIFESLSYYDDDSVNSIILKERKQRVLSKVKYLTNLISVDEKDVIFFNQELQTPAFWWPSCMPERFIENHKYSSKKIPKAVFSGTIYGKRTALLSSITGENMVVLQTSPDKNNLYHILFDLIHIITSKILIFWKWDISFFHSVYMKLLRYTREKNYKIYLNSISKYSVVLNLPSLVKAYPGRVTEAMSVGSVVISNIIEDRSQNLSLFKDQVEIILFSSENPEEFSTSIKNIIGNQILRENISKNAFENLKNNHTIEKRIYQVVKWLQVYNI